jgi:hypothetical protein
MNPVEMVLLATFGVPVLGGLLALLIGVPAEIARMGRQSEAED